MSALVCQINLDLAGRLTQRDYRTAANSPSGAIADSDVFTHNASGQTLTATSGRYNNVVAMTYDDAGRQRDESLTISGQTYTVGSQYDTRRGGTDMITSVCIDVVDSNFGCHWLCQCAFSFVLRCE